MENKNTPGLEETICIIKDIIQELDGMKVNEINEISLLWKDEIINKGIDKGTVKLINEICDVVIKLKYPQNT